MRCYLLFLSVIGLLFFSVAAKAQSSPLFEHAFSTPQRIYATTELYPTQDNGWIMTLLVYDNDSGYCGSLKAVKLASDGTIEWDSIGGSARYMPSALNKNRTEPYQYYLGGGYTCINEDYVSNANSRFILKLKGDTIIKALCIVDDPNSVCVQNYSFPVTYVTDPSLTTSVINWEITAQGDFVLLFSGSTASNYRLVKIDSSLTSIVWKRTLGSAFVSDLLVDSNYYYVTSSFGIEKYNTNGGRTDYLASPVEPYSQVLDLNDSLLVVRAFDNLYLVDKDLNPVDSMLHSAWPTVNVHRMVKIGNGLWLRGTDRNTSQYTIIMLDSALQVVKQLLLPIDYSCQKVGNIAFNDSVWAISGMEEIQLLRSAYIKTFDYDGNSYENRVPMAITNVEISNVTKLPVPAPFFENYLFDAAVTVENIGNDTIFSFRINYEMQFISTCGKLLNYYPIDSISLAPGEQATINLKGVENYTASVNTIYKSLLFINAINNQMLSDCNIPSVQLFPRDYYVGLNDMEASDITISPNPAQDFIQVSASLPLDNLMVSIYNVQGQLVSQQQLVSSSINTSNLQPGIYFIELSNASEFSLRTKFVKL